MWEVKWRVCEYMWKGVGLWSTVFVTDMWQSWYLWVVFYYSYVFLLFSYYHLFHFFKIFIHSFMYCILHCTCCMWTHRKICVWRVALIKVYVRINRWNELKWNIILMCLDYILVNFEQNFMTRNVQNFEL